MFRKQILTLLAMAFVCSPFTAMASKKIEPAEVHSIFKSLLQDYVRLEGVDYKGLAKKEPLLDEYLSQLQRMRPEQMGAKQKMAFWINAYNAFTLKLIVENYPLKSIRDIPSAKRWNATRWKVGEKLFSLDSIEHKILRPMGDARIHFAINCASISCPDLVPQIYLAETLDKQLDSSRTSFLSHISKGVQVEMKKGLLWGKNPVLTVSKIFKWFSKDFIAEAGSVQAYIGKYGPESVKKFIQEAGSDLKMDYFSYDWNLNSQTKG